MRRGLQEFSPTWCNLNPGPAAAEIKRLRAINADLLEALREARGFCWGNGAPDSIIDPIDAAIDRATTPIISAECKG